jgi:putative membrane protein
MGFLLRTLITAVAIWVAARLVSGIQVQSVATLVIAALVLGIVNAVVRPVLVFFTFPLTLLTLGLFLLVLNAFCLWLTSVIVPGFIVRGFWSALLGSILVSIVSWILTAFLSDTGRWQRV